MEHSLYLVAGLGKTGLSIARYLHQKNKPFMVFDTRKDAPGVEEFHAEFPSIPLYLQDFPEHLISQLIEIISSPGIPLDIPLFQSAVKAGVTLCGDIEYLAREIEVPVIAITGTNGKSTVTTLVGEMAKAAGLKVAVAGNIGTPVLDILSSKETYDLWVLELSSFQLDLTHSLAPVAATILNVSPDHLDRHHTLEAYIQAKQKVYHKAQVAVFSREDTATVPHSTTPEQIQISFGKNSPNVGHWGLIIKKDEVYLAKGSECILPVSALRIKGVHNWFNALAACALAEAAGIALEPITKVLSTFSGLPHRCQWVRSKDEVEWINDSKGTNVGATISAINGIGGSMQGKIVLIAGGQGKGADFQDLAQPVSECVRSVILIGEDADKIEEVLAPVVPISKASSLEQAVTMAQTQAKPGDVVLLSPACASLDMFRDFNHRGDVFASCVNGL